MRMLSSSNPLTSRERQAEALAEWLKQSQPCLFGRMAAKTQIAYCIRNEANVFKGEGHVREVIHQSRRIWLRNGFLGKQYAFVIALILYRPLSQMLCPGPHFATWPHVFARSTFLTSR